MHCLQEMWERALKTQNVIGETGMKVSPRLPLDSGGWI